MGKDKTKGRVKGNLQAADSSRAADLLSQQGAIPGVRSGFSFSPAGAATFGGAYLSNENIQGSSSTFGSEAMTDSWTFGATFPEDIKVVLKKLSKRDAVTKIKALEELNGLIKNISTEDTAFIKEFLPIWTKTFIKCGLDVDNKVRQRANECHSSCVVKAGKYLAPHLKDVMAAWLCCYFDSHREVARVAKEAFTLAFPVNKQASVLSFCLKPVVQFISDTILHESPETMSDPRFANSQEMNAKFSRIISACYSILCLLSTVLDETGKQELIELLHKLVQEEGFWKFQSHESSAIRTSIYKFIKTTSIQLPALFESHLATISPWFLGRVFIKDDSVSTAAFADMWEAVLVFSKSYPSAWTIINKKSQLFQHLLQFIQNGCQGTMTLSFPCLLPLIASFPKEFTQSIPQFHSQLLTSLWKSSIQVVDASQSDVFEKTYFECCFWFILHSEQHRDIQHKIVWNDGMQTWAHYMNKWSSQHQDNVVQQVFTFLLDSVRQVVCDASVERGVFADRCHTLIQALYVQSVEQDASMRPLFIEFAQSLTRLCLSQDTCDSVILGLLSAVTFIHLDSSVIERLDDTFLALLSSTNEPTLKSALIHLLVNVILYSDSTTALNVWKMCLTRCFLCQDADFLVIVEKLNASDKSKALICTDVDNFIESRIQSLISEPSQKEQTTVIHLIALLLRPDHGWVFCSQSLFKQVLDKINHHISLFRQAYVTGNHLDAALITSTFSALSLLEALMAHSSDDIYSNMDLIFNVFDLHSYYETVHDDEADALQMCISSLWDTFKQGLVDSEYRMECITYMAKQWQSSLLQPVHVGSATAFVTQLLDMIALDPSNKETLLNVICIPKPCTIEPCLLTLAMSLVEPLCLFADMIESHTTSYTVSQRVLDRFVSIVLLVVQEMSFEEVFLVEGSLRSDDTLVHVLRYYQHVRWNASIQPKDKSRMDQIDQLLHTLMTLFPNLDSKWITVLCHEGLEAWYHYYTHQPPHPVLQLIATCLKECREEKSMEMGLVVKHLLKSCVSPSETLHVSRDAWKDDPFMGVILVDVVQGSTDTIKESQWTFKDILPVASTLYSIPTLPCTTPNTWLHSLRSMYGSHKVNLVSRSSCSFHALVLYVLESVLTGQMAQQVTLPLANFIGQLCVTLITDVDVTMESHKMCFYYGIRLYKRLLDCATHSPHIWNMPQLQKETRKQVDTTVFNVFLNDLDSCNLDVSVLPAYTSLFEEYIAERVSELPEDILFTHRPLDKLCRLLYAKQVHIQKTAYLLLQQLIKEHVQVTSLGIEMNTETEVNETLATSIVQSIVKKPLLSREEEIVSNFTCGYLLAWMAVLDYFEDATFALKSSLVSHVRSLDAEFGQCLETVFAIIQVTQPAQAFDMTKWDVDVYRVEGLDDISRISMNVLAAHVLWRLLHHLPTLVRHWWTQCKNRQLTLAVEKYIEKYCTPLLISKQVTGLQQQDASQWEGVTIKASLGSPIVTAIYEIEDSSLEMVIKLPPTFPLRQVEIESGPTSRVGVPENRWRSWLLSSTAVLVAQNGSLADAISIFGKNIRMHFQGVEDCAICYSVIGAIDRTIPSKQCKTCKHLFHGACLYKWFKTSHAPTCPLCRQYF